MLMFVFNLEFVNDDYSKNKWLININKDYLSKTC